MANKNINNPTLEKLTDFTDELNRVYASVDGSTVNGYMVIKELIDYILASVPGGGDMLKSVYDTDDSGVVDDSELINGDTVANDSAVAANTSKVSYDDDGNVVLLTGNQTIAGEKTLSEELKVSPKITVDPDQVFGTTTGYWFGDGDTGFYENIDDTLQVRVGGIGVMNFSNTGGGELKGSANGRFAINNSTTSSTIPNFRPRREDTDTGLGSAALDQLSLIAGGVEGIRVTATGAYLQVIKSGATQAAAGANANEMWKTSGHATLPDNVIMHGV